MIDERYAPYGIFLLRVALGTVWLAHASLKWFVFSIPGFALWLTSVDLPAFAAWPVFIAEVLGGLAIVLGLYARLAALALVPVLLVALSTHVSNGWVFTNPGGGWEYPLFLITVSIGLSLLGDGAFAMKSLRTPEYETSSQPASQHS